MGREEAVLAAVKRQDAFRPYRFVLRYCGLAFVRRALGWTKTGNWHEDWLPEASVAVHWMIVVPRGKKLPLGGTHTTTGEGSRSSVALTVKLTLSPPPSEKPRTVIEEGHDSAGAVESGQPQ